METTTPHVPRLLFSTDPADRARMGGKAAALAALAAAEFPVPAFLVIPADAFAACLSPDEETALAGSAPPGDAPIGGTAARDGTTAGRTTGSTGATPSATGRTASPGDFAAALASLAPSAQLLAAVRTGIAAWGGGPVAVRSSGVDEDGSGHTFAGQFESYLFVTDDDLGARIADVWRSGFGERVLAYRREHGLGPGSAPAVLVQQMIAAESAGVAFSADPVSGRRAVAVVSAVWGLGTALVGGDADADTYRVAEDGTILARDVVAKPRAHRPAPGSALGIALEAVPAALASAPALDDTSIRAVAELARRAEAHFGRPEDIEWAFADGVLHLLQARPITALARLTDPDGKRNLWDNSNIVESYSGITTPLTFSFALGAYEGVYREFCRILGVSEAKIEAHAGTFARMLGLIRGRVYYNLLNWYRVLALLPGFTVNRAFMENMMGVREGLPDEVAAELAAGGTSRWRDRLDLARAVLQLLANHALLGRKVRRFYTRLDEALAPPSPPLERMRLDELAAAYRDLEARLLSRWDAPLINDFFAMIHFGVLGRLTTKWCGDEQGTLQNELVAAQGGMISAEPAHRVRAMARLVRDHDAGGAGAASEAGAVAGAGGGADGGAAAGAGAGALGAQLRSAPVGEARRALRAVPEIAALYDAYLARFGDRCLDELKLESATLEDDPTPLLRAIGNTAAALEREAKREAGRERPRTAEPDGGSEGNTTARDSAAGGAGDAGSGGSERSATARDSAADGAGDAGDADSGGGSDAGGAGNGRAGAATGGAGDGPGSAAARVQATLRAHPVRRLVFTWVLRNARARVRDRENLRFERTRLFGRVRRIFLEMGRRLWAEGRLADPRDVFYLEVGELLGFVEGTATSDDLAPLAAARRARFAAFALEPAPPRRFETHGAVHLARTFVATDAGSRAGTATNAGGPRKADGTGAGTADGTNSAGAGARDVGAGAANAGGDVGGSADSDLLVGLGCCPGVVRGPVRVVRDPRGAVLEDGEILVAERTDPGWILLFPAAAALLVERGSLLSHSAIVARELGIPAIVSIEGLTARLSTGDWVEMDGSSGRVRRIPKEPR